MLILRTPLIMFVVLDILLSNTPLFAQIATDGTLGVETNLTGPNFEIPADLGQQRGSNLFHSFKEFNINTNESAIFTGPDSIQNILTKVTGGHHSWIDGTLTSKMPQANLYLLNPSGIMFGENAKLDVLGSFHASTAEVLRFQDGGHFDALEPNKSQLTVAPPKAFGFLNGSPASISIQGNQGHLLEIKVNPKQTLSFIGGDLTIQDSRLLAPSGQINLVAMASAGEVSHTADNVAITTLGGLGKITLSQSYYEPLEKLEMANLDASGSEDGTWPGGHIVIRAGQLFLDQGRIWTNTYSGTGRGIDIEITEKISLKNSAWISASNLCQKDCENTQGGDISVKTRHLSFSGQNEDYMDKLYRSYLRDFLSSGLSEEEAKVEAYKEADRASQSRIDTNNYSPSPGKGGDISIRAEVLEMGPGVLETMNNFSEKEEIGPVGNIRIDAQRVILTEGGNINSSTHSADNGGNITINGSEFSLLGSSFITASSDSSGAAGDIELNIQRLTLKESWIKASSNLEAENAKNAGKIHIRANELSLTKSSIATQAMAAGGGDITVDVEGNLLLLNKSFISASARGDRLEHSGGNVTINYPSLFVLEKSQLFARANNGDGGKIRAQEANHLIFSYPFEQKEYYTEFGPTLQEKIDQGFTLIDASSNIGRPGKVQMEGKQWVFKELPPPPPPPSAQPSFSNRCSLSKEYMSRFIITARDILPRSPEDLRTHTIRGGK